MTANKQELLRPTAGRQKIEINACAAASAGRAWCHMCGVSIENDRGKYANDVRKVFSVIMVYNVPWLRNF